MAYANDGLFGAGVVALVAAGAAALAFVLAVLPVVHLALALVLDQ